MANLGKTQGYMAKIGLDLSDIDKQIKSLETELKAVDKALSQDANNTVLLNQKYTLLGETIGTLDIKLASLLDASSKVSAALSSGQITDKDFREYERAVETTKNSLSQFITSVRGVDSEIKETGSAINTVTADFKDLPTALTASNTRLAALKSELDTIQKAMKNNADSTVLANQKYTVLNETARELETKLAALKTVSNDANRALAAGEITPEQYREYEREIENTTKALQDLNNQRFPSDSGQQDSVEQMAEAVRQARTDVVNDLGNIHDHIADWTSSIAEFGEKAVAVLGAAAQDCIEVGKQFETSMSLVAATMGVDQMSEDYQRLEQAAKDYGATTRYTAAEVAEALNYMALAGYDTSRSIETLPNLLNLAQAGGLDFARASEMLTNSVAALGIKADDVAGFIDKMAVTARSSGTNVEQLGEALLRIGGTARTMIESGGGLTELDTVLGILADNGIKASEGGTKLRNILLKMAKPTKGTYEMLDKLNMSFYDMEGNMRPLPEIFQEMADKMSNLTREEKDNLLAKAFNARDVAAINALLNTSAERYDTLAAKINAANGAAGAMATTMNDNLQGALYQLKSAKEAVEIEIYQKMQEPLGRIVNLTADTVRGINAIFEDENVGKEFTEAFNKIAAAIQEQMPNIIKLFEDFAKKIVPRLGEMTTELVNLMGDKVLPAAIDAFEWIADHGAAVEGAIKLIVGAMVTDKVIRFGDGLFGVVKGLEALNTNLVDLGTKAPTAAAGLTATGTAGEAAAGGAAAASTALGPLIILLEAVTVASIALAAAFDDMGEAAMRNAKYMNGFSDASNENLDRYVEITSGKNTQSSKELAKQLEKDTKELEKQEKKLHALHIREEQMRKAGTNLSEPALWEQTQKDIAEVEKNIQTYKNLIHEEDELYNKRLTEEKENAEREARTKSYNDENARRQSEAAARNSMGMSPVELAEKRAKDEEEARQIDEEAFSEELAYQEDKWARQWHWDQKNQKEYWEEKEKWLKENEIDSEAWWTAWNETEAKLGKISEKTGKEIDKNLKDAEKEIKDKLTSYKNNLDLAVAQGMSEWDANEKLGEYLRTNLDHNSELYKTEYTAYLNKQKKLSDQMTKEQDEQYKKDVKAQTDLVKQKFQELENQAKWEGWSDRHLWNEKFKLLKQYKKDGTIYIETYDDIHQDLINEQATIVEKERKERDAQAKKDNEAEKKSIEDRNKERKKIFEDAEKEAEDIVKNYYTKSRDELSKFGQSGQQTVTDAKGKERLVFSDYNKKLQELKAYQKNLERLKNMGLSNEHLKEIFSMDLDTRIKYISELINMGAANREKYLRDYNIYQKTVNAVSQTEVKMQSAEIKSEIDSKFKEMTEDAGVSGESAGKAYMIGFKKGLKGSGFNYIDFLPTSIMDNAAAYDVQALAQANKTNSETVDLLNKTLGGVLNKPVTININDRKSIELTFADLMKIGMNSGSKIY
ncbi:MAG: phage tail tape measure protein [Lachnospiraceae bacterium]|nr:phage tail tape measure protein [Lachnospiraceae bacterium]